MNKFLSLFLGALMMMSCSAQNAESFKGKMYQLQNAPENAEITLGFGADENRIFGIAAINNYFGSYQQEGDKLSLNLVGSTMMAGPEELMKAEQEYLQTLPTIQSFKLDGRILSLFDADGKEYRFEEIGKAPEE